MQALDVLVIGGGNAALCAALAAADRGARVQVLEKTSPEWRGGNSKYTRNIRLVGQSYSEEEFLADLVNVTGEGIDRDLATLVIERSGGVSRWMESHGVRWQPPFRGTLQLARTNRFFLGGGKALLNTYYDRAERAGVEVRYHAEVVSLQLADRRFRSAIVDLPEGRCEVSAPAVVVASGGFESNLEWLGRYWGEAVDNYIIRGTSANDGRLLADLLSAGALQRGNPRGFHAVACDARSPRYEGGIVTRVDSLPFGIVVNRDGRRFGDEGQDLWPKRYASWGGLIAQQPYQLAFSVFDSQVLGRFIPPLFPALEAVSIEGLAAEMKVDPGALATTVREFNLAVQRDLPYDFSRLDGRGTRGLQPAKSNWALPIEHPPFFAYPMRPGITFTYLAVGVDRHAHVLDRSGRPLENVFAAGEVMAGNILLNGYVGGVGLTIGTVFGRIAGEEAAAYARAA
ncbi:MAG TPA: FAD-dependent tricarballylate dehydrogenase TcuA [Candidatus Dormibacteraeota bacterium]|nr:FAD-dependent tricarballylate dehydrogenase TcuA [Candidatus Dormibacteraeota bacterium]